MTLDQSPSQQGSPPDSPSEEGSPPDKSFSPGESSTALDSISFDDDFVEEVHEYETFKPFRGWSQPTGLDRVALGSKMTTQEFKLAEGWIWENEWHIVTGKYTDDEGWQYNKSAVQIVKWRRRCQHNSYLRRRLWCRTRVKCEIPLFRGTSLGLPFLTDESSTYDTNNSITMEGVVESINTISNMATAVVVESVSMAAQQVPQPFQPRMIGKTLANSFMKLKFLVMQDSMWRQLVSIHYREWTPIALAYHRSVVEILFPKDTQTIRSQSCKTSPVSKKESSEFLAGSSEFSSSEASDDSQVMRTRSHDKYPNEIIEMVEERFQSHITTLSYTDGCPINRTLAAFAAAFSEFIVKAAKGWNSNANANATSTPLTANRSDLGRDCPGEDPSDTLNEVKQNASQFCDELIIALTKDKHFHFLDDSFELEMAAYRALALAMQDRVYQDIITLYQLVYKVNDETLTKVMDSEEHAPVLQSHIPEKYRNQDWGPVMQELKKMSSYCTSLEKVEAMLGAMRMVVTLAQDQTLGQEALTPIMVWCVYKSKIPFLYSECYFMLDFLPHNSALGPCGVALSLLELAVVFLQQLNSEVEDKAGDRDSGNSAISALSNSGNISRKDVSVIFGMLNEQ